MFMKKLYEYFIFELRLEYNHLGVTSSEPNAPSAVLKIQTSTHYTSASGSYTLFQNCSANCKMNTH